MEDRKAPEGKPKRHTLSPLKAKDHDDKNILGTDTNKNWS